jgi:hypothetical protein
MFEQPSTAELRNNDLANYRCQRADETHFCGRHFLAAWTITWNAGGTLSYSSDLAIEDPFEPD